MPEVGAIIENVEIIDIGYGGDGVARLGDGAVAFVPYTAKGDKVTLEVTDVRRKFCRGSVRSIVTLGAGRTKPVCPFYGLCGGCVYQHLTQEAEIDAKRAQFASLMTGIGHFGSFPALEGFTPSPARYGYRNKLRLEPVIKGTDSLQYGFCQRDNRTFFPVNCCPLAMESINSAIPSALRGEWAARNAKRHQPFPLTLRADAAGQCAFYFGTASPRLKWMHEVLEGRDVSVPVGSFWQVNPPVAAQLIKTLREWLAPLHMRALIDAYAGVGTFSLALTDLFQYRVVIESDRQAVTAARFNHAKAGLKAKFLAHTTENVLDDALAAVNTAETLVVLDPPRTGCLPKVLKSLQAFRPTLVYVSCNPTTLARDLQILCAGGAYVPVRAAAFNMFAATAHFESMVLLRKA